MHVVSLRTKLQYKWMIVQCTKIERSLRKALTHFRIGVNRRDFHVHQHHYGDYIEKTMNDVTVASVTSHELGHNTLPCYIVFSVKWTVLFTQNWNFQILMLNNFTIGLPSFYSYVTLNIFNKNVLHAIWTTLVSIWTYVSPLISVVLFLWLYYGIT